MPRETLAFVECAACAAKSGFPVLCDSCLHNREVIRRLIAGNQPTPGGQTSNWPPFVPYWLTVLHREKHLIVYQASVVALPEHQRAFELVGHYAQGLVAASRLRGDRSTFNIELTREQG